MKMYSFLLDLDLQFFADGGEGGSEGGEGGQAEGGSEGGDGEGDKQEAKTFTQDELNEIIKKEKAKAKRAAQKELEESKKLEGMGEVERLQAEKTAAEQKATAIAEAANNRLKTAEAKAEAIAAGVSVEKSGRFMKLVDLSAVEVDDEGNVDTKALKAEIAAVLKEFPEFVGSKSEVPGNGGGADFRDKGAGEPKTLQEAIAAHYKNVKF